MYIKTARRGGRQPKKIDASLNEKLNSVEWGEYKLGDLFDIKTTKSIDKNKITFNQNGCFEFIGRSKVNNGVQGRVDKLDYAPNPSNTFSLVQVGESICQFRENEWYASQNIFILIPLYTDLIKVYLYVTAVINKALGLYSDAYTYPTIETVKKLQIYLPIKCGKVDYEFMENFIAELEARRIAELEARRIAELEAYLLATGLKDYTLTADEIKALEDYETFSFQDYTFDEIFDNIQQGRRLKKDDQLPGEIPFVMAGVTNTGVVGYISNPVACFPKNSITIDIFGNTFYRDYDFGAGDDTGVYWNEKKEYTPKSMLYFATAMEKSLRNKFSYGKKLRSSQSFKFKMKLPTVDGKPDYKSMDTFISAIQKLVIKDVVLYADRKVEETKNIVENKS